AWRHGTKRTWPSFTPQIPAAPVPAISIGSGITQDGGLTWAILPRAPFLGRRTPGCLGCRPAHERSAVTCDFGTQTRCRAGRPYLDAPRAALGHPCGCGAGPGVACLLCAIRSPQPCVPVFLPFRRGRVPAPYWRWAPSCAAGQGGGGPNGGAPRALAVAGLGGGVP